MNISNKDFREYFRKISSKKITKRILNEYIYLKRVLYFSIILFVLIITVLLGALIFSYDKPNNVLSIIVVIYCIFIFYTFFQIDNKKFKQLESAKRRYYILFLMQELIYSNEKKKRYKLWSLCRCYSYELYLIICEFSSHNIFHVSKEEYIIRQIRNSFKDKLLGLFLDGKHEDEIKVVITNLLTINYIRNTEQHIDQFNKTNEFINYLLKDIISDLDKLDTSEKKIEFFRLDWFINNFTKGNVDIVTVIFFTLVILGTYFIVNKVNHTPADINTYFQLLIGTPAVVLLFINLIKNKRNG